MGAYWRNGLGTLNDAGHLNSKLTIILNDNEMSIAPNVGALAFICHRSIRYIWFKKVVEQFFKKYQ